MNFENDTGQGIFGIGYLLPFNFESEWRVDTNAEFRLTLENSLQLTNNINLIGDFEYDTESEEEWSVGIEYSLSKELGIVTQFHSEFGIGAGIRLTF